MKLVQIIKGGLISLAVLIVFLLVEDLVQWKISRSPLGELKLMEKDFYNEYGLPEGQMLAEETYYEDENYFLYADRILKRPVYHEQNIRNLTFILHAMLEQIPGDISFSVVPIPRRIVFEEGFEYDKKIFQEYMATMQEKLPDQVGFVDAYSILKEHESEYIYFRTENIWTMRAAYYVSAEVCKQLDIEPFPLEGYNEYMYKTFMGSLVLEVQNLLAEESPEQIVLSEVKEDPCYYYQLAGGENRSEIGWHEDDVFYTTKLPTIQKGDIIEAVIGSFFEWAIVKGDARNKEKEEAGLLLLCDEQGKLLAPYFANYYKEVYVINIKEYYDFSEQMKLLLEENQIEDIVFAQTVNEMGDCGMSRAILGFFPE